jgi:hypothetical protein
MTRRAFRVLLFLGLVGTAALAGYQGWRLERARVRQLASAGAFDALTLRLSQAVIDLRASERAYVSAGQGFAWWKPRVDTLLQQIRQDLTTLESAPAPQMGSDAAAGAAVDAAIEALGEVTRVERRIAQAAEAGRIQFAADLVYADGLQASLGLERATNTALIAAKDDLAAYQRDARIQELLLAAESAGIGLFLALMWFPSNQRQRLTHPEEPRVSHAATTLGLDLPLRDEGSRHPTPAATTSREPAHIPVAAMKSSKTDSPAQPAAATAAPANGGRSAAGTAGSSASGKAAASAAPAGGGRSGAGAAAGSLTGGGNTAPAGGGKGRAGAAGGADSAAAGGGRAAAGVADVAATGGTAGTGFAGAAAAGRIGAGAGGGTGSGAGAGTSGLADAGRGGAGTRVTSGDAAGREVLVAAADLCTSLARVTDSSELVALMGQVSRQLDAAGVIVWLVDAEGLSLRAALSHGYGADAVGRLGRLDLASDNATARAFRLVRPQTVPAKDSSPGAIVVPITTGAGCVGAVSAELRHGREQDAGTLALARIFAAQLASLTGPGAGAASPGAGSSGSAAGAASS